MKSKANFHFASGFLLITPKPLQGTSSNSLSAVFSKRLMVLVLSISLGSTLLAVARRARFLSSSNFHCVISIEIIRPLFCINAERCNVFPPPPAQASMMRMPGSTSKNSEIACDPAS